MTLVQTEPKKITMRQPSQSITTVYSNSSGGFSHLQLYTGTVTDSGVYTISCDLKNNYSSAHLDVLKNGFFMAEFETTSTSWQSFQKEFNVSAGDDIQVNVYGLSSGSTANAYYRNVLLTSTVTTEVEKELKKITMRPNGTEKQIRPAGWQPGANTIAYYPLENDVNDHSGNGYNLTPTNITYTTLSSGLKVATFNGSSSKAITSSFSTYSGNFTTSMWFYGDNITAQLAVMRCNAASDSSGRIRDIHIGAPNRIRAIMNGGGVETGTNAFTNNTWYYMVVTKEGSTGKVYINNSLKSTATVSYNTSTNMAFGYRQYGNDRYWKGYISKFIIENKARTAQEVSDYYNQTKGNYGL